MAKLTGKDISATVAATAITGLRTVGFEETDEDVVSSAAGDAVVDRDSLRLDYSMDLEALVIIAAPYVLPTGLVGTKVAWTIKTVSGHTANFLSSTGKVKRFFARASYDGLWEIGLTIEAAGTAVTKVLTGA